MERKSLLFLLTLLMPVFTYADRVSEQEALKIAQQFMKGKVFKHAAMARRVGNATSADDRCFYVFNAESEGGFVIVAADDRVPAVLGYSENSSFDSENVPPNVEAWLQGYAEQIKSIQETAYKLSQLTSTKKERPAIAPMIKTKWNQRSPYNEELPMWNGKRCPTGCVSTALAQIMYYHQHPKDSTSIIPAYTTETNQIVVDELPKTIFDWSNMTLTYNQNSLPEQNAAVAHLMKYCSAAIQADYKGTETPAYFEPVVTALKDYFGYGTNVAYYNRKDYSSETWDNMVYYELENKRPVLYSGASIYPGYSHAFIIDGYDGNGYYSVNWGWGGSYDGFFLLSNLNPKGSPYEYYSYYQDAIMGVSPDKTDTYQKTIDGLCYELDDEHHSAQVIYSSDHDKLRKINIPSTIEYGNATYDVTSIGDGAFASNNSYSKSVSIPESVTSIGVGAFRSCMLKSIVLPINLEFIGDGAFLNTRLTSIEIPENVTYIGKGVFSYCKNLSEIKVSEKNRKYDSRNNCNAIIETESNTLIQGCGGSTIPLGVTSIGAIAFSSTAIRDVIIPQGVTSIDSCAFLGCDSLKSVFIPNTVVTIGNSAFSSCRSLSNISFPDGACSIHNGAFHETAWYNAQPDGVVYAGRSVYKYKGNMPEGTDIVIKDSTLFVCDFAFQECSGLKSVTFPSSLTTIGSCAFHLCSGLKSITFPSSLTTIGSSAFWVCSQLESVFIPSSVEAIIGNPFPTCDSLAVITVDKDNKYYDSRGNCNAIIETKTNALIAGCRNTIIPDSITSIQNGAFFGCNGLSSIAIPATVTSIWKNSFYGCEGLKEVKSYIKKPFAINDTVFLNRYNSYRKATLYVPSGTRDLYLATDGWKKFKNIVEMKAVDPYIVINDSSVAANNLEIEEDGILVIPEKTTIDGVEYTVTEIAKEAFKDNVNLTEVTIPQTVVKIASGAFAGCSNLKAIYVLSPLPISLVDSNSRRHVFKADNNTIVSQFDGIDFDVCVLYVPFGSEQAYREAYGWCDFKRIVGLHSTNDPAVTVTAKSYTRVYGDANPTFEFTSLGATLTGTPQITCEATAMSPVGTYDIIISQGSVTNYNATYVKGTLTITKAPLTIKAGKYTKKQGEDNPVFALTYNGFKNNETRSVLEKKPTVTCEATKESEPGEYAVKVSGAEAQNYDISYVNGTLTVMEADPVTITANSYTRVYGDANPTFDYTSTGAPLTGNPLISCEATATSSVGTYDIIVSKGSVTNYNVTYVKGTLTITPAPLTIEAGIYSKKQGEENPEFTLTYEGFKNNETEAVLTKKPTVTCEATKDSAPGDYEVVVSGAEAWNYDISYQSGWLKVEEAQSIQGVIIDGQPFDVYNIQGRKVRSGVTTLKGLPKGVYIVNGIKVVI